jgi:glutamyl-Q tRNA(Asp) synthetase
LRAQGLLYPCFCTRAEIQAELAAMAGAPQGPEGPLYPGTCRLLSHEVRAARLASGAPHAWRLDAGKAMNIFPPSEPGMGGAAALGDVVLSRKEMPASYHLAVVVDDAATGVTLVTRGNDLESATGLHVLLQRVLGLPMPAFAHHRLITDDQGRRLAKRDQARSLAHLRASGATPADIRLMVNWAEMEADIAARLPRP